MVESQPSKLLVAGSIPVSRSRKTKTLTSALFGICSTNDVAQLRTPSSLMGVEGEPSIWPLWRLALAAGSYPSTELGSCNGSWPACVDVEQRAS